MVRYKKNPIQNIRDEITRYSSVYLRHGGKSGRQKQVKRLLTALLSIQQKFGIKSVHQVGRKHVHWWDQQLRNDERSLRTRDAYFYGFKLLWDWLDRNNLPPRPK